MSAEYDDSVITETHTEAQEPEPTADTTDTTDVQVHDHTESQDRSSFHQHDPAASDTHQFDSSLTHPTATATSEAPKKPRVLPPGNPKPTPAGPSSPSDASAAAAAGGKRLSFSGSWKTALANLDPLGKELNKSFHQVLQLAGEKLGTAETTQLPQEYLDLEARIDNLRALQENLIRVVANQISPGAATNLKFSVYGTLNNLVDSVGPNYDSSINSMADKLKSIPVTITSNQVLAQEFTTASAAIGEDTSLGRALSKAADAQKKIGKARTQMNNELTDKFIKRLSVNLETTFRKVNMYRRSVHSSRVKLDALKTRVKSLTPEKADAMAQELQAAQDEFHAVIAATVELMKAAAESTEPLLALVDMMGSMLAYFQTGYELLSTIAPELDAIKDSSASGGLEEPSKSDALAKSENLEEEDGNKSLEESTSQNLEESS